MNRNNLNSETFTRDGQAPSADAGQQGWEQARLEDMRRFVALTPTEKLRLLVSMLEFTRMAQHGHSTDHRHDRMSEQ